ncbi:MAG: cytosine permease, partial [Leptospiraceae bacterium]|nr:cytosine permease [Leptospiraceae bacterium]
MSEPAYTQEAVQDYPLEAVPAHARHSAASLYFLLLGFTFFTATMWGGGRIGVAFPFWPDLVGIIVTGNLLLGAYVAALAFISYRSGLNTVLLARFAFGEQGSRLMDTLLGFTQIGWYAWGTATIASVAVELAGWNPMWKYACMPVFGLAFCWTAYIGYRGLEILSYVAVPLMTALILWSIAIATDTAGGLSGLLQLKPEEHLTAAEAITIVFGTFASGGTQVTNWTRFARTGRTAVLAGLSAFTIGNGLMIFMGAYGAMIYAEPDVVRVLTLQGLLLPGVIMLFLNIWTTQDNTIYNFSVAGCNLLRTEKRRLITVLGAVVGTVLALLGMDAYLTEFLLLLGTFIPPIGGVLMGDFLLRKSVYPHPGQAGNPVLHWSGLLAYIGASTAAYLAGWLQWGIPPLLGVALAFGLTILFGWI